MYFWYFLISSDSDACIISHHFWTSRRKSGSQSASILALSVFTSRCRSPLRSSSTLKMTWGGHDALHCLIISYIIIFYNIFYYQFDVSDHIDIAPYRSHSVLQVVWLSVWEPLTKSKACHFFSRWQDTENSHGDASSTYEKSVNRHGTTSC